MRRILVGIKRVVDYNVRVRVKPDGSGVVTDGVKMSINPFDEIALEEALRLRNAASPTKSSSSASARRRRSSSCATALAMGADRAILVRPTRPLEPLDRRRASAASSSSASSPASSSSASRPSTTTTTRPARCWRRSGTGRRRPSPRRSRSPDDAATVTREVDAGLETLEVDLPAVVTTDLRLNEPRYVKLPDIMKAKNKPLDTSSSPTLGVDAGAALKVTHRAAAAARSKGVMVKDAAELVAGAQAEGACSDEPGTHRRRARRRASSIAATAKCVVLRRAGSGRRRSTSPCSRTDGAAVAAAGRASSRRRRAFCAVDNAAQRAPRSPRCSRRRSRSSPTATRTCSARRPRSART